MSEEKVDRLVGRRVSVGDAVTTAHIEKRITSNGEVRTGTTAHILAKLSDVKASTGQGGSPGSDTNSTDKK